jgi:hypothetical protein
MTATTMTATRMTPIDPNQPDTPVLEYRPRAANPAPRVGPSQWLQASLALGGMSWLTVVMICVGTPRLSLFPVAFAAAGLATGIVAAVQPLPRESSAAAIFAVLMSFLVLAIWLLAHVLF